MPGAEAESRMIRATIKLMAERGYNGFSLADVAEAAGHSRGLSGHYFGPKDQMLADVAQFIVRSYRREGARPAQAACPRQFAQSADKRLAKKRVKKVKRGRIVAVRDPKNIEVLELRDG